MSLRGIAIVLSSSSVGTSRWRVAAVPVFASASATAARTVSALTPPTWVAPPSVSESSSSLPSDSRRNSTTVMLSLPPPSLAAAIRSLAACWSVSLRVITSASVSSDAMPVNPSEQIR